MTWVEGGALLAVGFLLGWSARSARSRPNRILARSRRQKRIRLAGPSGTTGQGSKLDRRGRNLTHLVDTVQDLSARGVGLRVLAGQGVQVDTTTAAGRLVFGIFAALA